MSIGNDIGTKIQEVNSIRNDIRTVIEENSDMNLDGINFESYPNLLSLISSQVPLSSTITAQVTENLKPYTPVELFQNIDKPSTIPRAITYMTSTEFDTNTGDVFVGNTYVNRIDSNNNIEINPILTLDTYSGQLSIALSNNGVYFLYGKNIYKRSPITTIYEPFTTLPTVYTGSIFLPDDEYLITSNYNKACIYKINEQDEFSIVQELTFTPEFSNTSYGFSKAKSQEYSLFGFSSRNTTNRRTPFTLLKNNGDDTFTFIEPYLDMGTSNGRPNILDFSPDGKLLIMQLDTNIYTYRVDSETDTFTRLTTVLETTSIRSAKFYSDDQIIILNVTTKSLELKRLVNNTWVNDTSILFDKIPYYYPDITYINITNDKQQITITSYYNPSITILKKDSNKYNLYSNIMQNDHRYLTMSNDSKYILDYNNYLYEVSVYENINNEITLLDKLPTTSTVKPIFSTKDTYVLFASGNNSKLYKNNKDGTFTELYTLLQNTFQDYYFNYSETKLYYMYNNTLFYLDILNLSINPYIQPGTGTFNRFSFSPNETKVLIYNQNPNTPMDESVLLYTIDNNLKTLINIETSTEFLGLSSQYGNNFYWYDDSTVLLYKRDNYLGVFVNEDNKFKFIQGIGTMSSSQNIVDSWNIIDDLVIVNCSNRSYIFCINPIFNKGINITSLPLIATSNNITQLKPLFLDKNTFIAFKNSSYAKPEVFKFNIEAKSINNSEFSSILGLTVNSVNNNKTEVGILWNL
jgi:hypothetical protein